jgi:hypothetical protein
MPGVEKVVRVQVHVTVPLAPVHRDMCRHRPPSAAGGDNSDRISGSAVSAAG